MVTCLPRVRTEFPDPAADTSQSSPAIFMRLSKAADLSLLAGLVLAVNLCCLTLADDTGARINEFLVWDDFLEDDLDCLSSIVLPAGAALVCGRNVVVVTL